LTLANATIKAISASDISNEGLKNVRRSQVLGFFTVSWVGLGLSSTACSTETKNSTTKQTAMTTFTVSWVGLGLFLYGLLNRN
jgi:hypothetical protein